MAAVWSKRKKILVTIAAVLLVPTMVFLPGIMWEFHQANKALRTFEKALREKHYQQAYELTTKELQSTSDYATFLKAHENLTSRFGDLQRIEISSSKVEDRSDAWYGFFEVSLAFSRGANVPFSFVLKKQDGIWKIYSYHEL